jgi:AcrR family transcriptional regulator
MTEQTRTARKKERTTKLIMDTAMVLFRAKGVDATSMEEIAREADIAKGTLYNYFPEKEAIINEYMVRRFKVNHEERLRKIDELENTRERLVYMVVTLITGVKRNSEIFEKYLIYHTKKMVTVNKVEQGSGFNLIGESIIKKGQENGELRDDIPLWVLKEFFEFIFIEIAKQQRNKEELDMAMINQHIDLFLSGTKKE